jgi:PHS family inorganic phosphate transporter-like MFS transporter
MRAAAAAADVDTLLPARVVEAAAGVQHVLAAPRRRLLQPEPLPGTHVAAAAATHARDADASHHPSQKDVFAAIGWLPKANEMNALEETYRIARAQALIALGSTVPGYWFTVFTIDRLGRKVIQVGGFLMMTLFMAALAGFYIPLRDHHTSGFVTMYALTFFFSNFGPNATTFVIPAELFPTAWKSTAHGICAASGKAGAIIGAFGFLYASQPTDARAAAPYHTGIGLRATLGVLAAINFCGMFFTLLIPETKGKSLEELNGEDGALPSHHLVAATVPAAAASGSAAASAVAPPPAGA